MITKIRAADAVLRPELLCGEANFRTIAEAFVRGIGGAVAGGYLMHSAGFSGYRGTIYTTLVAIIGAVILTVLAGLVNGRRLYARQL